MLRLWNNLRLNRNGNHGRLSSDRCSRKSANCGESNTKLKAEFDEAKAEIRQLQAEHFGKQLATLISLEDQRAELRSTTSGTTSFDIF